MSRRVNCFITVVIAATLLPISSFSGGLEKRSRLELRAGWWQQKDGIRQSVIVGPNVVETSIDNGGVSGSLSYAYWMRENLSVYFTVGVMPVKVDSHVQSIPSSLSAPVVSQNTVMILPVLFGVRYYLSGHNSATVFRPYLAAAVGPYIGHETKSEVGVQVLQESRTTTVPGGRLGAGIDMQLSRYFMLGIDAGYNLLTEYSDPLGGRENYSGAEFGFGVSWLFGKGIE